MGVNSCGGFFVIGKLRYIGQLVVNILVEMSIGL